MASNPAATLASTLQSASLNRAPSPTHDLNPPTSASSKPPVRLPRRSHSSSSGLSDRHAAPEAHAVHGGHRLHDGYRAPDAPRRTPLPPLPDLRFEQSYMASLRGVEGWSGVGWVTVRDQVVMPLVQGTLWTLALSGWRYWNREAQVGGATVGGRIRRWWWGVNNWEIPGEAGGERVAGEVKDFYTGPFAAGAGE